VARAFGAVHFVGVGGSGMSPLAEILLRQGVRVSGSDLMPSAVTAHLEGLGLVFYRGHAASHVGNVEAVVRSSAVRTTNPEVQEAERRGIPVLLRGQLLADLMAPRQGVAIAGAHGKTTTTAMVGLVLDRAGLDPTVVIGGRFAAFGSHARVGRGPVLVAEADESDRSFLLLRPRVAVVTNIDQEHLESYRDFDGLVAAFERFATSVPADGSAVLCVDDPHLRAIAGRTRATPTGARVVTYGVDDPSASLGARDVSLAGYGATATILKRDAGSETVLGTLSLGVPGRHNVSNALAAIAVALEFGVAADRALEGLAQFRGAERRFERKGEVNGVVVIDDYGHHPTEVTAVLNAARATGAHRIICVFQPHRYTRTAHLLAQFGPALARADEIVLTDIYPAGEEPIPGVTIEQLAQQVQVHAPGRVRVVKALADLPAVVAALVRTGDMVITLGAGSIGTVGPRILEELAACQ
jgi:UDP-N-acetylmuramate--alanine ligase